MKQSLNILNKEILILREKNISSSKENVINIKKTNLKENKSERT